MKVLTVLQVGDVHYPDHLGQHADVKDQALDPELVKVATASELQASTRALLAALGESPEALVAFTGDLTSKGDLDQYTRCVDFLDGALLLGSRDSERIHVVPGNHDVNRTLAAGAPPEDLYSKFTPLAKAWTARNLHVIATDGVRETQLEGEGCSMRAYGLNSCLGCGERRQIPAQLRAALTKQLEDHGLPSAEAVAFTETFADANAEIVDAPAYAEGHVHHVYEGIRESPETSVAVLIAHHNVLQQAQPRFDLYTDLINAGMFRARLSSLDVPVLYLHGHIHSDPVEQVTQDAPDRGQLVCISAPEFRDGFNQIDVAFADSGIPLGCVIRRFRVRLHGGTSVGTRHQDPIPGPRIADLWARYRNRRGAPDPSGLIIDRSSSGRCSGRYSNRRS